MRGSAWRHWGHTSDNVARREGRGGKTRNAPLLLQSHSLRFLNFIHPALGDYATICINKSECMYVCVSQHNYLFLNGILSFPSFTRFYKYKEEYKQGEMWHSAQRAEISWPLPGNGSITTDMFQPGRCQATGTWLISGETNNEELLIARQRFCNHGYIDGNIDRGGYKRKAQLQESSPQKPTIYLGNTGKSASISIKVIDRQTQIFLKNRKSVVDLYFGHKSETFLDMWN
jgi:hypothetical protein